MNSWLLINSGKCDAAFNMALDEALLEAMPRLQQPILRFYGWTEPAATFGYFQKFSDVEQATSLRPLIRRPTGGGIVPHYADWTYSAAFPPGHEWHSLKAEESYRRIHDWLRLAFAELAHVGHGGGRSGHGVGHADLRQLLRFGRLVPRQQHEHQPEPEAHAQ